MTEEEYKLLRQIQHTLYTDFIKLNNAINGNASKDLDALHRDLMIAQASLEQSLLNVINIRAGLYYHPNSEASETEPLEAPNEVSHEKEDTAKIESL